MSRTPNSKTNKRFNKLKSRNIALNDDKKKSNIFTSSSDKKILSREDLENSSKTNYLDRIDNYYSFFTSSQLNNIDFSKFENHVFFDSAVSKVNFVIKRIINDYPYDKTLFEKEQFLKKLNGYTSYILKNRYPNFTGYLNFDGTHYVKVFDENGRILKDYNGKTSYGNLSFGNFNLNFDFWIKPIGTDNNQIIAQKYSNNVGYTVYLTNESDIYYINLAINSNNSFLKSKHLINHNTWNHFHISIVKNSAKNKTIIFYHNGIKQNQNLTTGSFTSENPSDLYNKTDLFIGKGEDHNNSILNAFNNGNYFTGYLDEFKISRKIYNIEEIRYQKNNNINQVEGLKLYLKFNEPNTEYSNNYLCLDSSGNKLHGIIYKNDDTIDTKSNNSSLKIEKTSSDTHLKYERKEDNPVLFPEYQQLIDLQEELLSIAKRYDIANPNVFWKIMPKSLFEESNNFEESQSLYVNEEEYTFSNDENNPDLEIQTKNGTTLVNIMTIWARFFDQIKLYIDTISEINNFNYNSLNTQKNVNFILPLALKKSGFDFKEIFPSEIFEKINNKNLTHEEVYSEKSIREIQNNLWKRFLINSQDYLRSKGTIKGIKNTINSFGINPDKFLDIREYHGKNILNIKDNTYEDNKNFTYLNFFINKHINNQVSYTNNNLLPDNRFLLRLEDTSSSQGTDLNDFNYTKSWSYEANYKFNSLKSPFMSNTQSLIRLERSTNINNNRYQPVINCYFQRESNTITYGKVILEISDNLSTDSSNIQDFFEFKTEIDGVDLINGNDFYLCITKELVNTYLSKYTLYVYESNFPYEDDIMTKEIYVSSTEDLGFEISDNYGYFEIGYANPSSYTSKNGTTLINPLINDFQGEISSIKTWSKSLTKEEINTHAKDLKSNATLNPLQLNNINEEKSFQYLKLLVDFNFNYEKLKNDQNYIIDYTTNRIDLINKQNFENVYFDNNNNLTREDNFNCFLIKNDNFNTVINNISEVLINRNKKLIIENPKIDEPITSNGININYLENSESLDLQRFETLSNFVYNSDLRFSIDFSSVKFLNENISKILLVNDYFSKVLSNSNNRYSSFYKDLKNLKDKYYLKLDQNIDYKPLYQVYKYFDNILSDLLNDAVSTKVSYKGFNFIVESSILERHKYEYKMSRSHVPFVDQNPYITTTTENKKLESNNKFTSIQYRNFNENVTDDENVIITNFRE